MITFQVDGVKEARRNLDPAIVNVAARRTVNKVVRSGRTEASKIIRKKFAIKKSELDPTMTIKTAKGKSLTADLEVRSRPISLIRFNPRALRGGVQTFGTRNKIGGQTVRGIAQKKVKRPKYSGVEAKIVHDHKTILPSAFIARGKGGVPVVFARKSDGKLRALRVITVPSMVKQPQTWDTLEQRIIDQEIKVFQQELKYELSKRR